MGAGPPQGLPSISAAIIALLLVACGQYDVSEASPQGLIFGDLAASWAGAAGSSGPKQQQRRNRLSARRFILDDLTPMAARGTCRLEFYTAAPPAFGLQQGSTATMCSGGESSCAQPCAPGFDRVDGTSVCMQHCPRPAEGPHHLCPVSRTCIRGDAVCPMLSDVLYKCTARDQFLPACAKQTYQAVLAARPVGGLECSGLVFKDAAGGWRCAAAPDLNPCAAGFANVTEAEPALGAHCKQECPPWLVDCGDACHAPGVPCSAEPEHLCPIVSLEACSADARASLALQTACQAEGFRGVATCPLSLAMHGGCGGAQLQVATGLRRGSLTKLEFWGLQDGPLRAIRLTFANDNEPVAFGNESVIVAGSPQQTISLEPAELVVRIKLWTSLSVLDGAALTPVLAGVSLSTSRQRSWVVGRDTSLGAGAAAADPRTGPVGAARQHWAQSVELSGGSVGVGLPVGAAAYSSSSGIHAFGLLFVSGAPKQEL